jgi:hypothetical protein
MRFTRLVAALLLAAYLPACTSYRALADPASGLQASLKPIEEARITLETGERFTLRFPQITDDSLRGSLDEGAARSVALTTVSEVEVRKHSAAKTVALVFGVVAVAASVFLVVFECYPETVGC